MSDLWKKIVLKHEAHDSRAAQIVIEAIEKHLKYDTSLVVREDIDKSFSNERIENLAMKGLLYFKNNKAQLQIVFPKQTDRIVDIVRAHLIGFEPNILCFDIKSYEIWRDNLLLSKNKMCQFYAQIDSWLRKVNKRPIMPEELSSLQGEFAAYNSKHESCTIEEWLQKDCRIYFTKGYDSSVWKHIRFRIEDCAHYDFYGKKS